MTLLLSICTILGGIVAVGTLISPLHLKIKQFFRRAESTPIRRDSLGAYIETYPTPRELDAIIAADRGYKVIPRDSDWEWLLEMTNGLSIKTIRELDKLTRKHFSTARRLSHYLTPPNEIPTAFGINLILEVEAMRRGGLQGLTDFMRPLKLNTADEGFLNEVWDAYVHIIRKKSKQQK